MSCGAQRVRTSHCNATLIHAAVWLVAGLIALCVPISAAQAHAALIASTPADGAVLDAWPAQATLRFGEPVSPLVFRLVQPDGTTRTLDRVVADDDALRVTLPVMQMTGSYGLSWRVVSADGHPVGGTLAFAMGAPTTPVAAVRDAAAFGRSPVLWLARVALYAGLFFGVGGALLRVFVRGADEILPRVCAVRCALWVGLAAVPACLLLQGLDALDAPWRAASSAAVWRAAVDTSYFYTLMLALAALLSAQLAVRAGVRVARAAAWCALPLLGAALAASGHASAAPPQWLARPLVAAHVLAVAAWLGALLPLRALARAAQPAALQVPLDDFSRRIRWVVLVLLGSGLALAAIQLGTPTALWRTAYGRVLAAKLVLVAALFALAAWNRYRLTAPVLAGAAPARAALARIVRAEIVLALCVLAVVALWRFTPPPRALAVQQPPAVTLHLQQGAFSAQLVYAPGALHIDLRDEHGAHDASPTLRALNVSFTDASRGLEPLRREATQVAPGRWEVSALHLPTAHWTVELELWVTDFDRVSMTGELNLASAATDMHMDGMLMQDMQMDGMPMHDAR